MTLDESGIHHRKTQLFEPIRRQNDLSLKSGSSSPASTVIKPMGQNFITNGTFDSKISEPFEDIYPRKEYKMQEVAKTLSKTRSVPQLPSLGGDQRQISI